MAYNFTDVETVEKVAIKHFHMSTVESALDFIVKHPVDCPDNQTCINIVNEEYKKAQKSYDEREYLFGSFELDSEYYPIVIIRSLLPQLGYYLNKKDYQNARLVSEWIIVNQYLFSAMLTNLATKTERDGRSFMKLT